MSQTEINLLRFSAEAAIAARQDLGFPGLSPSGVYVLMNANSVALWADDVIDKLQKENGKLERENEKLRRMYCDGAESCASCELAQGCVFE